MTTEIPRRPASQHSWVNVQAEMPLAWPDDAVMLAAELRPSGDALERAQRYVRMGHVPQLRMPLAAGDSINDYLHALGKPDALLNLKRRAAVEKWNAGGAHGSPNSRGSAYRPPDLPYLRQMLAFTWPDEFPAYAEPRPAQTALIEDSHGQYTVDLSTGRQVEPAEERADYQHEPARGRADE